jgi:predicted transcriptional regulator
MGATKHISIRVSEELVKEMDAEAKRLERSRAWVISRRLENGRTLPPLYKVDRETGEITQIPEGGVKNGGVVGEGGNNTGVDKRGVGDGIAESDAGAVLTGSVRAAAGGGGGKASRAEKRAKTTSAAKKSGETAVSAGWFPNSLCPHGWQNSFSCEKNNGGCKR